ncbi:MAG: 16S rRNA (uracil(1498)-N(3))-methyltransferase [Thermodesulfobacteriota bacterium]
MNILLYDKKDLSKDFILEVKDEKAEHIIKVLKLQKGDFLKTGEKNGFLGKAKILDIKNNKVFIKPKPLHNPPQPLKLTLITGLPRPKVARRIIYTAAMLGVKNIHFINCYKTEKSYWQSPYLNESEINRQITNALEQSGDTVFPNVYKHTRFRPFAEDLLPDIIGHSNGYLLDPYSKSGFPETCMENQSVVLTGTEGGFTDYENKKIIDAGAKPYSFGQRILRVETAVTAVVSRFIS